MIGSMDWLMGFLGIGNDSLPFAFIVNFYCVLFCQLMELTYHVEELKLICRKSKEINLLKFDF